MNHASAASLDVLRRKLHLAEPVLATAAPGLRASLAAVQAFAAIDAARAPRGAVPRLAQLVLNAQHDAMAAKRRARSARTKAHAELVYELASAAYGSFLAAQNGKTFAYNFWSFDRAMKVAVGIDPSVLERALLAQALLEDNDHLPSGD